jgi:hypothetical protein
VLPNLSVDFHRRKQRFIIERPFQNEGINNGLVDVLSIVYDRLSSLPQGIR